MSPKRERGGATWPGRIARNLGWARRSPRSALRAHAVTAHQPTAAVLTPPGRGAVAVVELTGPAGVCDALFTAADGRAVSAQPVDRVAFGRWGEDPGEELVLVRTAADRTEIHCHGGTAAVARVLADLETAGAGAVSWEERIEADGGELAAELAAVLAAAPTVRTAGVLLDQASGTLARGLADPSEHAGMRGRVEFGRHLTEPWLVVIAGPPNAGKSSLLNRIAGFGRAIVSPVAGTTRDAVGVTVAVDGWPVRLTDTAGLRATRDPLEAAGVAKAEAVLRSADAVIDVADATASGGTDPPARLEHPRVLRVWNKVDSPEAAPCPGGRRPVSAATGAGVDDLLAHLAALLVPDPPAVGTAVPLTARHAALIGARPGP